MDKRRSIRKEDLTHNIMKCKEIGLVYLSSLLSIMHTHTHTHTQTHMHIHTHVHMHTDSITISIFTFNPILILVESYVLY